MTRPGYHRKVSQMKVTDEQIELAFSKGWRPLRSVAKGFGFTKQALHLRMKRLGLVNKRLPRRSEERTT